MKYLDRCSEQEIVLSPLRYVPLTFSADPLIIQAFYRLQCRIDMPYWIEL
jgi:hypothetical protein